MRTIKSGVTHALPRQAARKTAAATGARQRHPAGGQGRHDTLHEFCHDVRQPAAAIAAMVAAVQTETELPPSAQEWMRQITMETRRISELCRQVLGQGDGPAAVSLGELAGEVVASAGIASPATVTCEGETAMVDADPAALRRAIWNLVDNAMRAAGAGGRVTVTTTLVAGEASVVVADSGPGFGEGETGVAGLGMRIAGRVARELGGRLTIGSSGELGGAEVAIRLPATATPGSWGSHQRVAP